MTCKCKQAHSSLRKHLHYYFTRKQQQTRLSSNKHCAHWSQLNGGHAVGGAPRLSD